MNTVIQRQRTDGDGMMHHVVDTWTDDHGVTRCDVTIPHDVSWTKASALLPVIPGGGWEYAISHAKVGSFMATHRYVFKPVPQAKPEDIDWLGDLCPWGR
jgi:hypothetical protein